MIQPALLDRRKVFVQVAAHLEREILAGNLKPGDRLPPERDLRAMFGVGRPAIREALIKLQESGLIEIGNGMPARVTAPDAARILAGMVPAVQQFLANTEGQRQLQGVRLILEVGLVRHAARHSTPSDLARLEEAVAANKKAMGDREEFIRTDVAFHFQFAKIVRNPVFRAIYDAMSSWLQEQRRVAPIKTRDFKIAYDAHKRIFDAVASRDPDAAEAAMQDHLERGWKWSAIGAERRETEEE
jgi:GntR family transcriptional regulator, sialic acid-inducible nan operon repressor